MFDISSDSSGDETQDEREPENPAYELEQYLHGPVTSLKKARDPIAWWRARQATFPHLAQMALDYLTIPGTSHLY